MCHNYLYRKQTIVAESCCWLEDPPSMLIWSSAKAKEIKLRALFRIIGQFSSSIRALALSVSECDYRHQNCLLCLISCGPTKWRMVSYSYRFISMFDQSFHFRNMIMNYGYIPQRNSFINVDK